MANSGEDAVQGSLLSTPSQVVVLHSSKETTQDIIQAKQLWKNITICAEGLAWKAEREWGGGMGKISKHNYPIVRDHCQWRSNLVQII